MCYVLVVSKNALIPGNVKICFHVVNTIECYMLCDIMVF